MGILETRTLDFDNVIMLSLMKAFSKIREHTFIHPVSLRHGFDLPTPEHQDAIYAYYFYRLIQRGKNIFLHIIQELTDFLPAKGAGSCTSYSMNRFLK